MSKNILVADDDKEILNILERGFSSVGFTVTTAKDGSEAEKKLLKNASNYDVIILDVQMPKMNAFELLVEIRQKGLNIPVILMTGKSTSVTSERSVKFGSVVLVEKPFDIDELIKTVEACHSPNIQKDIKILVADDNKDTRASISRLLRGLGYLVETASDGKAALDASRAIPHFDIAMIDICMPGISGDEVLANLANFSPETLPIFITGEATRDEIKSAYEKGGYILIRKPIDYEALVYSLKSYEQEAAKRKKKWEMRRIYQSLPFYKKAGLWMKSYITAKPGSTKVKRMQKVIITALAVVIALMLIHIAVTVAEYLKNTELRIVDFMRKTERYMQEDEQRKERLLHESRHPQRR